MRTYKYQIRETPKNKRIGNLLDDMWQVHEYFHKWQRQRYKDGLSYANYNAMSAHLTAIKKITYPHWQALPSQAIQSELKRIDAAYQQFFKKLGGRPNIKKRHKFKSITFPGHAGWKLKENRLILSFRKWDSGTSKWKFDKVPYTFHKHRGFKRTIRCITIKRDTVGTYWLYVITDASTTDPYSPTGESVGIDFGLETYLTLSNGEKIQSPHYLKQSLKTLRILHKSLSRKVRGSNNWWRCVRQLARVYRHIANQRKDWHWKLVTDLCRRFDTLAVELLNLEGMKRLWGRQVSDLSFGQFVEILKFKCIKHHREFCQVGQWTPTTKPCSDCGSPNHTLSLSDRQWICPECGSHHDRDVNAARNILRAA